MNFERGRDPKVAVGLGVLGKRGLHFDEPWIKRIDKGWHVKYCSWALDGWYKQQKINIALFQFPSDPDRMKDELYPKYVITAVPGEPTHYDSIYRKIEYPEILSRFLHLLETEIDFLIFLEKTSPSFYNFLECNKK